MKNFFCLFCAWIVFLSACSTSTPPSESPSKEPQGNTATPTPPSESPSKEPQGNNNVPEELSHTKNYESVADLIKGFSNDFSDDILRDIDEMQSEDGGGSFRKFVENRKTAKNLHIPYFNNSPMPTREKDEYSNIALFINELFKQPSIWFYPPAGESNAYIAVTYLETLLSDEIIREANEKGCSWLLKQIDPEFLNVDNLKSYPEYEKTIKSIYEKEIALQKKHVKAVIREFYDDSRQLIFFVYDGLLIRVCADPEFSTPDWFKSIDFRPVELLK